MIKKFAEKLRRSPAKDIMAVCNFFLIFFGALWLGKLFLSTIWGFGYHRAEFTAVLWADTDCAEAVEEVAGETIRSGKFCEYMKGKLEQRLEKERN